jgi:hypothetical protein
MPVIDLTGKRFGRLTVLHLHEVSRSRGARWQCKCDCGNTALVYRKELRNGDTQSCGCLHKEQLQERNTIHGLCGTPEHDVWLNMITRCTQPSAQNFRFYGGRGIKVCARWRNDFRSFLADMGPRPSPNHWIDRIDSDGDYSPENCRWSTRTEQFRNRRSNRLIEYANETKTMVEWAEAFGLNPMTLQWRLDHGWSVHDALTTPVQAKKVSCS